MIAHGLSFFFNFAVFYVDERGFLGNIYIFITQKYTLFVDRHTQYNGHFRLFHLRRPGAAPWE